MIKMEGKIIIEDVIATKGTHLNIFWSFNIVGIH
jgi:hypothetical protein